MMMTMTVKKAEHRRIDAFELWCPSFFGRNDAEAETPVLWPPHGKNWLIGKDSDAGRDWGREEKGTTEDEMAGWHHWPDGLESEWTPGDGDGQGGLARCDSWGSKESDTTERLNWAELSIPYCVCVCVCVCVHRWGGNHKCLVTISHVEKPDEIQINCRKKSERKRKKGKKERGNYLLNLFFHWSKILPWSITFLALLVSTLSQHVGSHSMISSHVLDRNSDHELEVRCCQLSTTQSQSESTAEATERDEN